MKFKVLAAIEHNDRLYVPPDMPAPAHWTRVVDADNKPTGEWTAPSASHGRPIAVDFSGAIELTKQEGGPLREARAIGEEERPINPEKPKGKK